MKLQRLLYLLEVNVKYVFYILRYKESCRSNNATCVIFSRDRAMQLEALLESIEKYCRAQFNIIVQYSCSPNHRNSYENLIKLYQSDYCKFVEEHAFSSSLLDSLKAVKTKFLFFLVDDQVVVRPFDINEVISVMEKHVFFSLRLGKSITEFGIYDMRLTPSYNVKNNFLEWNWKENRNQKDWGYQFSVDGTVYRTIDVLRASLSIPFKAPNSYEDNMNSVILFRSNNRGMSYHEPVVINLIINASRREKEYEHFESGEYSTGDILELYNDGKRFSIEKISSINFNSTHYIIKDINTII